MSRFNVNLDKNPEEWGAIALKDNLSDRSGHLIVAGIVCGGLLASATTPLLGVVLAGYCLTKGIQSAFAADKNKKLITHNGCLAHVLKSSDFRAYRRQVGDEKIMAELQFADEEGMPLSPDAWEFVEEFATRTQQELPPLPTTTVETTTQLHAINIPSTAVIEKYDPLSSAKIDIISEMSDRITNTIVVGIPGSGKGILVSNAIREAKRKHPLLKVFVIDPKADLKETGYFDCCDVVKQFSSMDAKPNSVAAWAESAFDEYSKYAQSNERTLLVIDEGTMLGNKLQQAKSTLLVDKLTSYTSGGDSAGRNVWFMMQSPYVSGASLNLCTTSQMTSVVIAFSENIGAIAQWKSAKIFKQLSLDEVSDLIENSETGRAVYYGKTGRWYMMPQLKNYSGYDRDTRKHLAEYKPENKVIEQLEDSFTNSKSQDETTKSELSERAQQVLDYFNATKTKEPKTLRDMKKADRLAGLDDILLIISLTELVATNHLIFDGKDSWSKSEW
ncbi:MAG: hypothetical protein PUP91_13765 [Rhizonema sp. PD37]|nr:hypothetical protein [Rhizonema sp. PD37]